MEDIKEIVDNGLKAVEAKLEKSIEKFEGQLAEKGKVDTEVKSEVKELSSQFEKLNADLTALGQKLAEGFKPAVQESVKSIGTQFIKSDMFAELIKGNREKVRVEVKNTVVADGTTAFPMQKPGVIQGNFAPLTIRQVLPATPVTTNAVNALREASWTNDAAAVAQAAAKPESDLTFEQYNVPIQTIAHWIKVSNQLLADAPAVASYIDTRLRHGLGQEVDRQLLLGTGTSPQLSGLTDAGNFTAYTAVADDLLVDAINRAKYQLWAIGRAPDTVIVNPADWGAMERAREGAGTGMYLYGLPGVNAGVNPFGVQIVMSNFMPAGSFLIGAMAGSTMVYDRQSVTVEMGYVGNDFTNNLVTIRAEERLALAVERPTGLLYGAFTA